MQGQWCEYVGTPVRLPRPRRLELRQPLRCDPQICLRRPQQRHAVVAASASSQSAHSGAACTSCSLRQPSHSKASCNSSAFAGSGHASSRTRAMASASRRPSSSALSGASQRRAITAWVRRSSSGASSRKAYGRADSTSSASGEGCVRSRATTRISLDSRRDSSTFQPGDVHRFMQAVGDGLVGQRVVGDLALAHQVFGTGELIREHRRRPGPRPPCARAAAATFLPPRKRGSASATPATQRQRVMNIGASSSAWISSGRTVAACR